VFRYSQSVPAKLSGSGQVFAPEFGGWGFSGKQKRQQKNWKANSQRSCRLTRVAVRIWFGGERVMMTLEELQEAIRKLSPDELRVFREWFWEFDGQIWDKQLEEDIEAGRLDKFAEEAIRDRIEGQCTDL
jgi:hypothetical protein